MDVCVHFIFYWYNKVSCKKHQFLGIPAQIKRVVVTLKELFQIRCACMKRTLHSCCYGTGKEIDQGPQALKIQILISFRELL